MTSAAFTGGCQCGAIRFACDSLGRASVCHCRMCQRAFGGPFAALVTARGLAWTRGEPRRFRSSNKAQRGFCADCGTPMTLEYDGFDAEMAICAFDAPATMAPAIQVGVESRLPWISSLDSLPGRPADQQAAVESFLADLVSRQCPLPCEDRS
jgi:hypothetical protein